MRMRDVMSKGAVHSSAAPVAARPSSRIAGSERGDTGMGFLALQRASGNRAVARLLDSPEVRSARYERGSPVPPVVRAALAGGQDQPLSSTQRLEIAPHLDSAAGTARLHTDVRAAASAGAIGARAYT